MKGGKKLQTPGVGRDLDAWRMCETKVEKCNRMKLRIDTLNAELARVPETNISLISKLQTSISKLQTSVDLITQMETARAIETLHTNIQYYDMKQNIHLTESRTQPNNQVNMFFNIKTNNEPDTIERIDERSGQRSIIPQTYDNCTCVVCRIGERIESELDGFSICNNCGDSATNVIDMDIGNYKEVPIETSFYAYKRINHFKEILAQFQAKETTQIPDDILNDIKSQVKKERLRKDEITTKKTKEILKKLGYNKYYEHIPFIKDKLGIKPPVMPQELETTLCNLFNELQDPYAKCCPNDRVNFLNYYYTIYKLCELLDQKQFLPFFPMLKDRDKRIEQDVIWRQICVELQWLFIPTE